MSNLPRISKRQKTLAWICRHLAGDKFEERATNLLPEKKRIKGLRLQVYKIFSRMRYREAQRLYQKYGTHEFRK